MCPRRQPDPAAADRGVQVRRALAHQVRQPEQSLRARRRARRFGGQRVVRHARRQLIAEPLQAQPRALRHAHHVPLVAHRVAERVDAPRRIVRHLLHVREHHARRAQRAGDDSLFHDAVAHRARRLIAAAAHHRRSGLQARQLRHLRRDRARDLARFVAPRQNRAIEAEPVHHLEGPAPVHHVEHAVPEASDTSVANSPVSRKRT